MGPTVPLGIYLHVGKKFGGDGSHCTTWEELESRQVPLGKNLCIREELGKKWVTLCQ